MYIMEIFTPIQTTKGQKNVKLKEAMLKNPKNFKEFQEIQLQFKQEQIKPKRDKMFSALQVEELHTDESMEQVTMQDI